MLMTPARKRVRQVLPLGLVAALVSASSVLNDTRADTVAAAPAFVEFTGLAGASTFPDTNTRVYQAQWQANAAIETVIRGQRPDARFWSLAVVDPARNEVDSIDDTEIEVDAAGEFVVTVKPDCGDAGNCLEVGSAAPDRIFWRIYVPDVDECGGVGLPTVAYRSVGSSTVPPPPESPCPSRVTTDHAAAADSGANTPVAQPAPVPITVRRAASGRGAGSTTANAYVSFAYDTTATGNVVVRAKAPTYLAQHGMTANDAGRADGSEQVRYWSLCTTQNTRPVDCVRDEHVALDDAGFFTVLVAPRCPVDGFATCLRSGAGAGLFLYRNQLARPAFANEAGPAVCPPDRPTQFCGDYALQASYTARPTPPPSTSPKRLWPAAGSPGAPPAGIDGRLDDWGTWSPMVGGQWGYDQGELVYQDFLYDDAGPAGRTRAGGQSRQHGTTSTPRGTYRYPTSATRYAANAADLSRLRLALDGDHLRVAVQLNTLLESDTTVATLTFAEPEVIDRWAWPHQAAIASRGQVAVTLRAGGGTVANQITGQVVPLAANGGAAAVGTGDNLIEAAIPLSLLPSGDRLRVMVATGLWDPAAQRWMAVPASRSATVPGGGHDGTPLPPLPRIWNVGFRGDEVPTGSGSSQRWFEDHQSAALADGDIDRYGAEIDLTKLRAGVTDHPALPRGQAVEALFRSEVSLGEGVDELGVEGRGSSSYQGNRYVNFLGVEQPYLLYVPEKQADPAPLVVVLHGGSANHSSVANQEGFQQQVAEATGRVLVSPLCRGPNCQYTDEAELDVLEALADARSRVNVDPDAIAMTGYSMGGFGTYRLATRHPDLFSASAAIAARTGKKGDANGYPVELLPNLRNVPHLILHGGADELQPWANDALPLHQRLDALGYEHALRTYPASEHLTFALADDWTRFAAWLDGHRRTATPRHVTYRYASGWDAPHLSSKLVTNRAYWLSGIVQRDPGSTDAERLTRYADIDAVAGTVAGPDGTMAAYDDAGADPGGAWHERGLTPTGAVASTDDTLQLRLTNVASLTIDAGRVARPGSLLCVTVATDGPTAVSFTAARRVAHPSCPDTATGSGGRSTADLPTPGTHRFAVRVGS